MNIGMWAASPLKAVWAVVIAAALVMGVFGAVASPADASRTVEQTSISKVASLVEKLDKRSTFKGQTVRTLPQRLDGRFEVGGIGFDLGASGTGTRQAGYVDYGVTDRNLRVVAATDGTTASNRFGVVVTTEAADADGLVTLEVPLDLPDNATVEHRETGEIVVRHPGERAGEKTVLTPAMAVDSAGEAVQASYRIVGDKLVIKADLAQATGPVLIDPSANYCYWWGCDTFYSRGHVRWAANYYSYTGVASIACNGMGPAAGACRRLVRSYTNWIGGTWRAARDARQCVKMSMTWTGQVTGLTRYNCTWE